MFWVQLPRSATAAVSICFGAYAGILAYYVQGSLQGFGPVS